MRRNSSKLFLGILLLSFLFVMACSGLEYYPYKNYFYYPTELVQAERDVNAAQQAGKDTQCPAAFAEARDLKDKAFETYLACMTDEAIEMAKEASAKANALCPPPPAVAPTAHFSGTPTSGITPLSVQFTDKSTGDITGWSWDFGDGATSASRNPSHTYSEVGTYTVALKVTGPGGSDSDTKTAYIQVTEAPKPAPPPTPKPAPPPTPKSAPPAKVIDRLTIRVNFDFDKYTIRDADKAELEKAVKFTKKYPNNKIEIDGYTDSIGAEKYNQKLSKRRAEAVKKYLVEKGGCSASNITAVGHGETRPVASNKTREGRAQNRRVEILILSE